MTKFKVGDYQIYKFYNEETEDLVTEFFLPVKNLSDLFWKHLDISDYKERGYKIVGMLCVDKETYLNARLDDTVEEFLYMDKEVQKTTDNFNRGEISYKTYEKTMELIQDRKFTLLKKMRGQVRRIIRNDFNVENEIALQLYDMYLEVL